MAYTEFYMTTTGNDLNAGTTTADNALVTDVGGTYNQGTGAGGTDQYVGSTGTPFSATVVGEYISVYTSGATFATFVGKITAVNAGGQSVDVSLTLIYGTRPANASTKTAKTGGAWTSLAGAASTGILNTGTVPQSTRLNVKAGTYANTTTSRAIGLAGAATTPFWIDGYKTNPGDLRTAAPTTPRVPGTDIPDFTFTTVGMSASGTRVFLSNLSISNNRSGACFSPSGGGFSLFRVQISNASNNSAAIALAQSGGGTAAQCYFSVGGTTATACITVGATFNMRDCVVRNGVSGISAGTNTLTLIGCQFTSQLTNGVTFSSGTARFDRCTFYGATNGIQFTSAPGSDCAIGNCLFSNLTNGINQSSGTDEDRFLLNNNDYYTVTNHTVGMTDVPDWYAQTESSSPFTNAGGGDFTLATGALARQSGSPGEFETLTQSSYLSIGAYQPPLAAAGPAITWRVGP